MLPDDAETPEQPSTPRRRRKLSRSKRRRRGRVAESAATAAEAAAGRIDCRARNRRPSRELVEVWRPGGRPKSAGRATTATATAITTVRSRPRSRAATGEAVEGGEAKPREHHRRPRRHRISKSPARAQPPKLPPLRRAEGAPRATTRRPRRERFDGKGTDARRAPPQQGGDRKGSAASVTAAASSAVTRAATSATAERAVAPAICDLAQPARARSSGRSEFAVRKARGAEGAARGTQGLNKAFSSEVGTGSRQENASNKGCRGRIGPPASR